MKIKLKRVLSLVLIAVIFATSMLVGVVSASAATAVVYTTDAVRLRSSATTNADNFLVTLGIKEKLTLLKDSSNEWAYVSREDGTKGYCSVDYLNADPNGTTVLSGVTNDYDVNFRKDSSTSSAVISVLPEGTKFTVVDNSNELWVKAKVGSNTGFIYRTYTDLQLTIAPNTQEDLETPDWFDSSSLDNMVGETVPKSDIPEISIAFASSSVSVEAGKTTPLTLYSKELGTAQSVATFKSSDTSVATVSDTGDLKGLKEGTAVITATIDGLDVKATCNVTVTKAQSVTTEPPVIPTEPPVIPTEPPTTAPTEPKVELKLSDSKLTINSGNYSYITANKSVTWTTSDKSIVAVNNKGWILGKSTGKATITATTSEGESATCVVTVNSAPSGISLDENNVYVTAGKTYYNKAYSSSSVTWSTSDSSIAVVEKGFITAKKPGLVIITASNSYGTVNARVTVNAAEAVRFAYTAPNTAAPGETVTLYAVTDKTRTGVKFDVTIGSKTTTINADNKVSDGNTYLWSATTKTSTAGTHKVVAYAKASDGTYKTCDDANTSMFVRKTADKNTETLENRRGTNEIVTLVSEFEGYSPCIYFDTLANNIPTLGYGRVVYVGDSFYNDMTKKEAYAYLVQSINNGGYTDQLNVYLNKYEINRNQQQFDALLSFTYNLGAYAISNDSDFLAIFKATAGSTQAKPTDAYINDSGVNFREKASTSSAVLAVLNYGDTLTLLNTSPSNNWYYVQTKDGTKGYVYADYVTKGTLSTSGECYLGKVNKSEFTKLFLQYHHAGGCVWGLLYRRVDELDVFYYGEYTRNGKDNKYDYSFTCPSNSSTYL